MSLNLNPAGEKSDERGDKERRKKLFIIALFAFALIAAGARIRGNRKFAPLLLYWFEDPAWSEPTLLVDAWRTGTAVPQLTQAGSRWFATWSSPQGLSGRWIDAPRQGMTVNGRRRWRCPHCRALNETARAWPLVARNP